MAARPVLPRQPHGIARGLVCAAQQAPRPSTAFGSGVVGWVAVGLAAMALAACGPPETATSAQPPLSAVNFLTASDDDSSGYSRADKAWQFRFPDDHGPHLDFQTEWWYLTGHLQATPAEDREAARFGFQWTLFRRSLAPAQAPIQERRESEWASAQVYLAHFTVTTLPSAIGDRSVPRQGQFRSFERLSRRGPGIAGAQSSPFRVWIEDWSLASLEGDGVSIFPLRLQAAQDGVELDLELRAAKPMIFHGDAGLSTKNDLPGGASYYYSFPRLAAKGQITVDGQQTQVEGLVWLDREWSTSVLGQDQVGWDWFSLQLDDGRDLMIYELRRQDGSIDANSSGTLVQVDGKTIPLEATDFELRPMAQWTSPRSNATYPAAWHLSLPAHGVELDIRSEVADQELDVSFRYWEGAVAAQGEGLDGQPLSGQGYVELVGYAEQP